MHIYISAVLATFLFTGAVAPIQGSAVKADIEAKIASLPSASSQITAFPAVEPPRVTAVRPGTMRKAWLTAYSSTPDQTDDTPFITASGGQVRDGIVATNFLPFGTRVRIPAHFGDKVFVVEDRMHPRKKNVVDIWMPTREAALTFGSAYAEIEVLE